jgi:hypothetical protein
VWQLVSCGTLSSFGLVFVGLCLAQLKIYLRVGGRVVVRGALWFGKWSLTLLCGAFGGKETIDVLRALRSLERSSSMFFFSLFIPGLRDGWHCGLFVLLIFFLTSPLPSSPLFILPVY